MHFNTLFENLDIDPSECMNEAFLEDVNSTEASVGKVSSKKVTEEKFFVECEFKGKSDTVLILVILMKDCLTEGIDILKLD
jgi:hypothetical protein